MKHGVVKLHGSVDILALTVEVTELHLSDDEKIYQIC